MTARIDEDYRLELFCMVWERPAAQVAKELGISDVALGKLCTRLQIPKPPRGYWAKVRSGKTPHQPALKAFSAQIEEQRKKVERKRVPIRLSVGQANLLQRGLQELKAAKKDITGCHVVPGGLQHITPELAAQLLILAQARFTDWLEEKTPSRQIKAGRLQSLKGLVEKLLPLAREQVLVFEAKAADSRHRDSNLAIFVRLTPGLQQRIAELHKLVRDHRLTSATSHLPDCEHAGGVHFLGDPDAYESAVTEVCVDAHEVWIRFWVRYYESRFAHETAPLPLSGVVPTDLLAGRTHELPSRIRPSHVAPFTERLKALTDLRAAYELICHAAFQLETELPSAHLSLLERLWFGDKNDKPFSRAREAINDVFTDLDAWERSMEAEESALVKDMLGVEVGDDLVSTDRDKPVRIRVDATSLNVSKERLLFILSGRRYRKDGILGKQSHSVYIKVDRSGN